MLLGQASDHAAIVANMCNYATYLESAVNSLLNRIVGCYQLQFHPEVPNNQQLLLPCGPAAAVAMPPTPAVAMPMLQEGRTP